jgi:hypothetical protein
MTVLEKLVMLSENMQDEDFRTILALEFEEYLQTKSIYDEIMEDVDNMLSKLESR